MASLSSETRLGGAGSLRQVGSASGLADSRVREAGSGHCGKSSKHPTKFRAATWNVGTLKSRSVEEGMERGYGTQVTESQHEEDKAHCLGSGA